jgi:hypothetical protein
MTKLIIFLNLQILLIKTILIQINKTISHINKLLKKRNILQSTIIKMSQSIFFIANNFSNERDELTYTFNGNRNIQQTADHMASKQYNQPKY